MIFQPRHKPCPSCQQLCEPRTVRCKWCGEWFIADWNKGDKKISPIPTGLMIGYLGDRARLIGKEVA